MSETDKVSARWKGPTTAPYASAFQAVLLVLSALLISVTMRLELSGVGQGYSGLPTGYGAFPYYEVRSYIQQGVGPSPDSVRGCTSYSCGVLTGDTRILFGKYFAVLFLVTGLPIEGYIPLSILAGSAYIITFTLTTTAIARRIWRYRGRTNTTLQSGAVGACVLLLTPAMVSFPQGSAILAVMGWVILGQIFFLWAFGRDLRYRYTALLLILCLPPLFYTTALVLLVAIAAVFVVQGLSGTRIISRNLSMLYPSYFLAYFMYIGTSFFIFGVRFFNKLPEYLRESSRLTLPATSSQASLAASSVFGAANGMAVAIPVMAFLLLGPRIRSEMGRRHYLLLVGLLLSLPPLAVIFYSWERWIGLLSRMSEWGGVFGAIITPSLLVMRSARARMLVMASMLLAAGTACSSVWMSSERLVDFSKATISEESTSHWLTSHLGSQEKIFTDHRLAGPLIVDNHFSVTGINDYDPPAKVTRWLNAIYYSDSGDAAYPALTQDFNSSAIFLSTRMSQFPPGIKGYDFFFNPAPANFLGKFNESDHFGLVYNNGVGYVYVPEPN